MEVLGCDPSGLWVCSFSALRSKKELRVSIKDISGSIDFMLLKQDPEGTPHHVQLMNGQGMVAVFTPGREGWSGGRLPVIGELASDSLISYQGNQQRDTSLTAPRQKEMTNSWGLGQKVSHVSKE